MERFNMEWQNNEMLDMKTLSRILLTLTRFIMLTLRL